MERVNVLRALSRHVCSRKRVVMQDRSESVVTCHSRPRGFDMAESRFLAAPVADSAKDGLDPGRGLRAFIKDFQIQVHDTRGQV
jgi:hypothetical protein